MAGVRFLLPSGDIFTKSGMPPILIDFSIPSKCYPGTDVQAYFSARLTKNKSLLYLACDEIHRPIFFWENMGLTGSNKEGGTVWLK